MIPLPAESVLSPTLPGNAPPRSPLNWPRAQEHVPTAATPTPGAGWAAQLSRLEAACTRHEVMSQRLQQAVMNATRTVARQVAHAGLVDVLLPRDYMVKPWDGVLYLVKCDADGKPRFVASGEESLVTRCAWKVPHAGTAEVLEMARDLEAGWLDELVTFVDSQWASVRYLEQSLVEPAPPVPAPGPLRLVDLGRGSRRPSRLQSAK